MTKKKQGVYYILWLPHNEYWYVGQSTDIDERLKQHINSKKNDWHEYFRTHLDEFEYKEIELVDDVNKLRDREDYYIDLLNPKYTSKEANKGSVVGHLSDETKTKLSALKTGENNPMKRPEVAAKNGASHKGQIPWNKDKTGLQQAWNKGIHQSQEAKEKQRAAMKGHTPWNKGKKGLQQAWNKGKTGVYSEETIEKIRAAKKGCIPWNKGKTSK